MDKKAKIASIVSIVGVLMVLALIVFATPKLRAGAKKCNNGVDDDNDGLVDYPNDPGCSSNGDNSETSTSLVCDNGSDATNDRDTLADFRLSGGDPGCTSATDSSEIDGECDDGLDSADRDNLSDATDPGCTSTSDQTETDGECDDVVDSASDADSLGDAADPGCTSTSDTSEVNGQCDDLSDNDADTHSDFTSTGDSKCSSFSDNDESPRDFCSDTDGGIVSGIQGTVSGDDESVPYSFTDSCLDVTNLTERYCGTRSQDYAPLSINLNCAGNATTQCVNGACV